eukprot:1330407-Pyramimonas_sp.AAC.1
MGHQAAVRTLHFRLPPARAACQARAPRGARWAAQQPAAREGRRWQRTLRRPPRRCTRTRETASTGLTHSCPSC